MTSGSREAGKGFAGRARWFDAGRPGAVPRTTLDRNEERRLVAAARRGDARALERLLRAVSGTVYRFGKTFCRDPDDAEDTLQDVLFALVRSLDTFRGEAALSTWAFTVARRTCMRRRRLGARASSIESEAGRPALAVPDVSASPARDAERAELRAALERGIAALPDAQRDVLLLRDVEGRSAAEVGRALGLGERAVKSRLHRARLALREALEPALDGHLKERASRGRPAAAEGHRCPRIARMMSRLLEGEVDAATIARMEAHVAGCTDCESVCRSLRAAVDACRQWGGRPVPAEVRAQMRAAIHRTIE